MKILLYTDTPQIGGAELQMFLLAKFLDKSKFEPILCCSNFPQLDNWCAKFAKENIQVVRINAKHKHDPRHFTELKKIIKQYKIDVLHLQIWNPAACRYAFFAGKSLKIPIVITEHDPFKLSMLKSVFKKFTLKYVDKIVAISKNNQKILEKLYPKHKNKITMIHNGIDLTWWQSQLLRLTKGDIERIKTQVFQAHMDTLILIAIAELHERKGLKYLIEAVSELAREYPNIKLVIVGEGKERNNLEKLGDKLKLKANLVFLGRQKNIPQLLSSSDIFVLPSAEREAFGLVNLEAMICGLPVVTTKVGGIPEIVKDGETGFLVEPQNAKALKESLKSLIENAKLRKSMGEKGKKRVMQNFSAEKMAREYGNIYKILLT